MRAVVFVGPSLPPAVRPSDPMWEWRPPVRQGDVYRAAQTRPDAIGIIDGYFETVPTVWHKEILWAIDQGIPVYGAASIGALRAAELDTYGMIGVGRIYEDFRDGILQDDDEVAVLHGPEELGYPALTEAMVNIRATVDEAVTDRVLLGAEANSLVGNCKNIFYKRRCWSTLLKEVGGHLHSDTLRTLSNWLRSARVDRKKTDAESLLKNIDLVSKVSQGIPYLKNC